MPNSQLVLRHLIAAAARTLPLAQRRLDEDFIERLARHHRDFAGAEPGPVAALAHALAPAPLVCTEQQVTIVAELVERREREASVSLRIGGRVVSTFYQTRYATTDVWHSRVTVTTVNARPAPAEFRHRADEAP